MRSSPASRPAGTFGNPVLSVCGTDIVRHGVDLTDYVDQEFEEPRPGHPNGFPATDTVPFWSDYPGQRW
jgi:hypothetical protein